MSLAPKELVVLILGDTFPKVEGPPGQPKTLYSSSHHQEFKVNATNVGNLTSVQIRIVSACPYWLFILTIFCP
jgi:hypothetical protein